MKIIHYQDLVIYVENFVVNNSIEIEDFEVQHEKLHVESLKIINRIIDHLNTNLLMIYQVTEKVVDVMEILYHPLDYDVDAYLDF